jgi:hypothetical protein
VLAALGLEHLRVAIGGAGPCRREVIEFWRALGVPLITQTHRPTAAGTGAEIEELY